MFRSAIDTRLIRQLTLFAKLVWLSTLSPNAHALDTITLQLKWSHAFQFAGYYAAIEKGYYREAGLDVTTLEAKPGDDPLNSVLDGRAQYGVGNSSLLLARSTGKPVVVLATIFQHSPLVLIAAQREAAPGIHDLVDKRVMLEQHSDELLAYLKQEGVSLDRISRVEHSFHPQDLIDGKVDAISAYITNEPYFLDRAGFAYHTYTPRSAGIDFYADNLFTTEQELKDHPSRVKAFREASLRGWKYAMENVAEIAELIQTKYTQRHPREFHLFEAERMVPLLRTDLIEIGYMNPGRWRHIADTYADLGILPRNFPLDHFLYNPNPKADLTWFYLAGGLLALVSVIAIYIYRHNRRLHQALAASQLDRSALAASEARHRLLADHASDVIWTMDLQGNFTYVSPSVAKLRGYAPAEIMTQAFDQEFTANSLPIARQALASVIAAIDARLPTATFRGELEQPCKHDGSVWTEVSVTGVRNEAGEYTGLLGVSRDITERRQIEDALRESEFRWKFAIEGSGDGVWDWNIATNEAKYSMRWKTMLGYADGDILPTNEEWQTRIHPEDQVLVAQTMQAYLDGKTEIYVVEYRLRCKDGGYKWILGRGMVVNRSGDGKPLRMIGTHTDITERRLHEEQVRRLAFHDSLTNLPNRRLFNDRLTQAIATNHRRGNYGAAMFLDLDNFKPLNDVHGHEVGDLLLIEAAHRLQGCVREMDTVARFGGDEFVVMLSSLTADQAESISQAGVIAEKIRTTLSAPYLLPVNLEGHADKFVKHYCTVSIGVAMFNDHKTSHEDVIKLADAAMYQAKESGRNLVHFAAETALDQAQKEANTANFVKLVWRPAYSCGNLLIDEQHRTLLNDTNLLLAAILADRPKNEVTKLISVLIADALQHFKDEEAILLAAEYPDALAHAATHRAIEERANALIERFNADGLGSGELFQFLAHDVVARHMLGEDRKFFQYLETVG